MQVDLILDPDSHAGWIGTVFTEGWNFLSLDAHCV